MGKRKKLESSLVGSLLLSVIALSMAAHNITEILQEFPDFSDLNDLLTETNVDDEINAIKSFTLMAPSNAAMVAFRSANPDIKREELADLLRYHVILRYVTVRGLQAVGAGNRTTESTLLSTMSGKSSKDGELVIQITSSKILIGSSTSTNSTRSTVVNTVFQQPFEISIILVDQTLEPAGFEAVPITGANVTDILEGLGGYSTYVSLLKQTGVDKIFKDRTTGVTIFVPTDEAFDSFPDGWFERFGLQEQRLLMQYHALTRFYSLAALWRSLDDLVPTISTTSEDPKSYNLLINTEQGVVTIFSSTPNKPNATVKSTLYAASPFVMYSIDAVLFPVELLSDLTEVPITAPTPTPDFSSPSLAPVKSVGVESVDPIHAFSPADPPAISSAHVALIVNPLPLALLSAIILRFLLR